MGVPALYLIGRGVSALAGTVTVGVVYLLVVRVGGSKTTARTAALFMALSPLAVENSHLITTDMTAAAVATVALLACVSLAQGRQGNPTQAIGKTEVAAGVQAPITRSWIVAGAFAGLAAGVKYSAGSIAILLPLIALRDWRSTGRAGLGRLGLAAAAAIAAFLITTPYALLDASRFVRDLGYEFRHIASVTPAIEQGDLPEASTLGKVAAVFWHDLGIVGILAALIGVIVCLRSRNRGRMSIAVWVLVFLLPLLRWKTLYPRYLLPAWPAVLALAGIGVEESVRRIGRSARIPARDLGVVAILAAGLVLAPGTVRLVAREARRARPDPRIEMTQWLDANVPKGERIVTEKGGPFPDPSRYSIQVVDFLGLTRPDEHAARGVRYLVATGRERLVSSSNARAGIVRGLEAIREASQVVWSRDRYAIFRLRGEDSWETPVREALAAKDLVRARGLLENQTTAGAGTSHVWKTLGEVRAGLGDTTAAIAAYEQAARRDSTDVEIRLMLSSLHVASRRWDEALAELERALRVSPREPLIYHNLAVLRLYRAQDRLRAGDRASARTEWDAARAAARFCARAAPSDQQMTGVLDQVERMGARWRLREVDRASSGRSRYPCSSACVRHRGRPGTVPTAGFDRARRGHPTGSDPTHPKQRSRSRSFRGRPRR